MSALRPFGPGLWLADGGTVEGAAGFCFPTRMAVIRLKDGGLLLWSPVAIKDGLDHEVVALGPVRQLIAPNRLHHMFLGDWAARFPEAHILAAPGVAEARPDLNVSTELPSMSMWAGELDQVLLRNRIADELVLFHRVSGTVLFCDLIQHFPPGWFSGWRGLVARLDGMSGAVPTVPRKFRMALRPRAKSRATVQQILDWPVRQVVMAHGTPVTEDGSACLQRCFDWLKPTG